MDKKLRKKISQLNSERRKLIRQISILESSGVDSTLLRNKRIRLSNIEKKLQTLGY